MPRLLTSIEVAEYLSTTERHLKDLRARREIPFVRVGGKVRYRPGEIEAWLATNSVRKDLP